MSNPHEPRYLRSARYGPPCEPPPFFRPMRCACYSASFPASTSNLISKTASTQHHSQLAQLAHLPCLMKYPTGTWRDFLLSDSGIRANYLYLPMQCLCLRLHLHQAGPFDHSPLTKERRTELLFVLSPVVTLCIDTGHINQYYQSAICIFERTVSLHESIHKLFT